MAEPDEKKADPEKLRGQNDEMIRKPGYKDNTRKMQLPTPVYIGLRFTKVAK